MKLKSKLASIFTAAVMCITMLPNVARTSSSAANVGDKLSVGNGTNQHKGNCDGYSYEVWLDTTGGSGSMTLGKGATFKAEWSASVPSGNFLARRGLDFGSTKKATDYSYIGMDYAADYRQTGSNSGNSRLCVYGWFQNKGLSGVPLVEYYIIEDWVDWVPDAPGKMVTIDGAQYKIFQMDHSGPSINSSYETFKQYFSVRQSKRKSGHITVSDHFKAWENEGWGIGNLYEVALNAEGWQSSGYADITELDVYTGVHPEPEPEPEPEDEINYTAPSGSGSGVTDNFEGTGTDWTGRGDVSYGLTSDFAHGGNKSLYVEGRTESWNGFTISSDDLVAGGSYDISAFAGFKSNNYSSMGYTLGIQYVTTGTDPEYVNLVDATGSSGKWTELAAEFDIPSNAKDIALYVQSAYTESASASDLVPFFLDDVKLTRKDVEPIVTTTTTTKPKTTTTTTAKPDVDADVYGDANCDGTVNLSDAILVMQAIGNPDVYGVKGTDSNRISPQGAANADVNLAGNGLTNADALTIQKYLLKLVSKLPESVQSGSSTTTRITTTVPKTTTTTTMKVDTSANFFTDSFSGGTDDWSERGSASLSLDQDTYYSSGSSLKVTGREDTWQGAAKALDSSYKAGGTYSFSAAVLQATGTSQPVKMTLQYVLNGEEQYDTIAEATASDKKWTKLENTEYTIPEGATDLLVYVELTDSTGDYFLDDFQAAASGTASKVVTGSGTVGDLSAPTPSGGKVDPTKPMIAISFDDGTNPYGKRIINALAEQDFRATFFYVGNWIKDENQIRDAYSKGMEIANHTTSHPYLTQKSASEIRSEYDQCAAKLKNIIGAEPSKLLRLPYLAYNSTVQQTLNDVPLITCAIDVMDYNGVSKDQIVKTVKDAMSNGSANGAIVLCHETYESTAAAIEELAPYIKSQGWQIVTISEMFEAKGKQLKGGQIYTRCN